MSTLSSMLPLHSLNTRVMRILAYLYILIYNPDNGYARGMNNDIR